MVRGMMMDIGFGGLFGVVWCGGILIGLIGLVLMIWAVVDCVKNETDENNNRLIWTLIIILLGWLGILIYYFIRVRNR